MAKGLKVSRRMIANAPLSLSLRRQLEYGKPFFNFDDPLSEDELRSLWQTHRETIMREFIAKKPGHRPWGWWYFDHGKERPVTAPLVDDSEVEAIRNDCRFGYLHSAIIGKWHPDDFNWCGWPAGWGMMQQSEPDYLAEHGLLTKVERRQLSESSTNQL